MRALQKLCLCNLQASKCFGQLLVKSSPRYVLCRSIYLFSLASATTCSCSLRLGLSPCPLGLPCRPTVCLVCCQKAWYAASFGHKFVFAFPPTHTHERNANKSRALVENGPDLIALQRQVPSVLPLSLFLCLSLPLSVCLMDLRCNR